MANEARNAVASIYDEIFRSAKSPISIPDVLVRFVPQADVDILSQCYSKGTGQIYSNDSSQLNVKV